MSSNKVYMRKIFQLLDDSHCFDLLIRRFENCHAADHGEDSPPVSGALMHEISSILVIANSVKKIGLHTNE